MLYGVATERTDAKIWISKNASLCRVLASQVTYYRNLCITAKCVMTCVRVVFSCLQLTGQSLVHNEFLVNIQALQRLWYTTELILLALTFIVLKGSLVLIYI